MIAESFAVIRYDDNDRARLFTAFAQPRGQSTELLIDERDLTVVGSGFGLFRALLVWVPREVRVIHMHPGEEWRVALFVEPRQRRVNNLIARAILRQSVVDLLLIGFREVVVVVIETLREAELFVQDEGRDERAGAIAARRQALGQSGSRRRRVCERR